MNKAEITYKHKHDTEDVLQVIKGWLLATTYITPTKIKKTFIVEDRGGLPGTISVKFWGWSKYKMA